MTSIRSSALGWPESGDEAWLRSLAGRQVMELSEDFANRYAAATNQTDERFRNGTLVPPLGVFVAARDAVNAVLARLVPEQWLPRMVHGEHRLHLQTRLRPGAVVATEVTPIAVRADSRGSRIWLELNGSLPDNTCVARQQLTAVIPGAVGQFALGRSPAVIRDQSATLPPLRASAYVAPDQARRYAEASGDFTPIHLDASAAAKAGHPGPILHGICTLAMCAGAVIETAGGAANESVTDIQARMSGPVPLGTELIIDITVLGTSLDFVARVQDREVLTHGRVTLTRDAGRDRACSVVRTSPRAGNPRDGLNQPI
jgi:acyl dehydratase